MVKKIMYSATMIAEIQRYLYEKQGMEPPELDLHNMGPKTFAILLEREKDIMNEKIIKEIEETIDFNRLVRCHSLSSSYDEASRRSNEILAKAKQVIIKATDNYEKGLDDAWEAYKKLEHVPNFGGLGLDEICKIFNVGSTYEVFDKFSAKEVVEKIKTYEKKKEEEAKKEAAKPKIGDVIEVIGYCPSFQERGIFLSAGRDGFTYVNANGTVVSAGNDYFEINKTGEHVNILGVLK